MTTCRWLGRANARAQVKTHTIGGTAADTQVYSVNINGKTVSYTANGSSTNNSIAAALQVLLDASEITEFAALTWTVNGAIITSTADTAGEDHTITTSATGTGTFVTATSTAATGPNHWPDANNWSNGAVPVNGDDVIIGIPVSILYGLDQSAVTLNSLIVEASFADAAYIGLPRTNAAGYTEDEETYLKIGATTCRIGVGDGNGSSRIKIDFGSVQVTGEVRKTGFQVDQNVPPLLIKGTHASNAWDVQAGTVGFGFFGGESATLLTGRFAARANVTCGEGCTLGEMLGEGTLRLNSSVTELTQTGGVWSISGNSTIGTLTQTGGTLIDNSSGLVADAYIGGTLDLSGDASEKVFTDLQLNPGGRIVDPNNVLTVTNGLEKGSTVKTLAAS